MTHEHDRSREEKCPIRDYGPKEQRAEESGYDAGRAGMPRTSSDPYWLRGWDKGNEHRSPK
jgi:hypothetical protein